MEEMCDEASGRPDSGSAVERGTGDGRKLVTTTGGAGSAEDEPLASSSLRIPEADAGDPEAGGSGGSGPRRGDLCFPLDDLPVHEDVTPGAFTVASAREPDGVVPAGASECGPATVQGEGEPQLPNEQRQDGGGSSSETATKAAYRSVLHHMRDQKKHKPGRRLKKKTLMKMAKLLVIAKDWDGREDGMLNMAGILRHKDLFASIASQTETSSAEGGRTSSPTVSNRKRKAEDKESENGSESRKPSDGESGLQTASDEQKRLGDISSGTTTTCGDGELPKDEAAETSAVNTSKPRKRAAKAAEQKSAKNEDDAAREGPIGSNRTAPKVKRTPGQMIGKKTKASPGGNRRRKKTSVRSIRLARAAADGDEAASSQAEKVDRKTGITENRTQQRANIQRTGKKEVPASQQAGDVSLQEPNRPDLDVEAAPPSEPSVDTPVWDSNYYPSVEMETKPAEDEQPITTLWNKGGVPRRRRKDKAVDRNVLWKIKNEPVWEAATSFPPMDVKTEPRALHRSTHDHEPPHSAAKENPKKKLARKRRSKREKLQATVTSVESTEEEDDSNYEKLRPRTLRSKVTAAHEEYLTRYLKGSRKRPAKTRNTPSDVSNDLKTEQETSDAPNPKNTPKRKYRRKGQAARASENPPANEEPSLGLPSLGNVSGDVKVERKRTKRKMGTSGSAFKEAVHPPDSLESNSPREGMLGSTKRSRRSKWKADSFISPGGRLETTPEIPETKLTVQGLWSKGSGGKPTPRMGGATPELKDPFAVFEFDSEESTSEMKPGEEVRKKTTPPRAEIQHEYEAGAPEDRGSCKSTWRKRKLETTTKTLDAPSHPVDLKAIKQEPDKQDASSAPPARRIRRRRRRSKTHWVGQRKVKRLRISAVCGGPADVASSSLEPGVCESTDEAANLGQQEASTNVRHRPLQPLKSQKKKKKSLRCPFCRRCFRHIAAFTRHKRIHTGEKPFRCQTCGKSFASVREVNLHSKVHREPPAPRCPCCDGMFRSKAELIRHFRTHLNDIDGAGDDEVFRCSLCLKEFTKATALEKHRRTHCGNLNRKRFGSSDLRFHQNTRRTCKDSSLKRGFEIDSAPTVSSCNAEPTATAICSTRAETDGFPAPQGGDAAVLRCPICKQCHRHWCDYAQHLQTHRCQVCRWQDSLEAGNVSAPSPPRSSQRPSALRLQLITPKLGGRFLCGRCGKCFPRWNQLWLHQRLHRRAGRPFRCSACELEFHFLGSYVDHLREHAARTPHACPACPAAFADRASLRSHVSDCYRRQQRLKCSACGKRFSSRGNLRKHELRHRGAKTHACLPCGRAFSGHAALADHLEIHRRRLSAPRPTPVSGPFLFPYGCRKCSARFSSAELLQAHQVRHAAAGDAPGSRPETIAPLVSSRAPSDIQGATAGSSGRPHRLPVSTKKHLFRYPDPNRLYVVPVLSSEPPIVVQDAGEEDLSSDDQSGLPPGKPGAGRNSGAPRWPNTNGGSRDLKLLVQSLLPDRWLKETRCERAPLTDVHACTTCAASFTDIRQLHTHYMGHARGM
ncbi:uncharacterized protein LOC133460582 [Cololabis saira]|uniref:uncharacterized protein LOC133460582 n=1 Tax=Cololabis saira TaxID=129043 RepID=UPI002AD4A495|nr:uncharacterized protein LOC133460582 [Cololabis saira]